MITVELTEVKVALYLLITIGGGIICGYFMRIVDEKRSHKTGVKR